MLLFEIKLNICQKCYRWLYNKLIIIIINVQINYSAWISVASKCEYKIPLTVVSFL